MVAPFLRTEVRHLQIASRRHRMAFSCKLWDAIPAAMGSEDRRWTPMRGKLSSPRRRLAQFACPASEMPKIRCRGWNGFRVGDVLLQNRVNEVHLHPPYNLGVQFRLLGTPGIPTAQG